MRVAILISGGGSNMVALIKHMRANGYADPALVLSNDPTADGLSKAAHLDVPAFAINHRCFPTREAFEAELTRHLNDYEVDLICLAGFMRILTPSFAGIWRKKMLNIHPSLLPKYPGLNTHARAIKAGDSEAGCTVHIVTSALDEGAILGQASVAICNLDTPETLAARILAQEHCLYPMVLQRFVTGETLPVYLQEGIEAPMTNKLSDKGKSYQ